MPKKNYEKQTNRQLLRIWNSTSTSFDVNLSNTVLYPMKPKYYFADFCLDLEQIVFLQGNTTKS